MGEGGVATLAKTVVPPKLVLPPRNPSEAFIRGGLNSATPTPMQALISNFLGEHDPYGVSLSPLLAESLTSPCQASMDGGEPASFNNFINRGKVLEGAGSGDFIENLEGSMSDGADRTLDQPTSARYRAYMPTKLPISCTLSQLTIPPGLSPASLLESPVFLSMWQADPSPTTGCSMLWPPAERQVTIDKGLDECSGGSPKRSDSFNFRPFPMVAKSEPSVSSDMDIPPVVHCELESRVLQHGLGNKSQSYNLNTTVSDATPWLTSDMPLGAIEHQSHSESMKMHMNARFSTDGYKWKKYGQKQLKNSENPRSYYKCTYPNCLVKKQVERSQEGEITEIMYKGDHNHPKPHNTRRGSRIGGASTSLEKPASGAQYDCVNLDKTSGDISPSFVLAHGGLPSTPELSFNSACNGEGEEAEASRMKDDDDGEELDSKRRRTEEEEETLASGPIRTIREPRVVVQTVSEVDILDDGYRWRKYGQKVVKGHLHARNYYKCTSVGCSVRKHVERSSTDPKSVITTYEGKHNHSVPPPRGSARESTMESYAAPAMHSSPSPAYAEDMSMSHVM